jgi:glutamate synthase (NADPH/NADH) large chain
MDTHYQHLRGWIEAHQRATGSVWAREILNDYRTFAPKFWLVKPKAAELGSLIESLRQAA